MIDHWHCGLILVSVAFVTAITFPILFFYRFGKFVRKAHEACHQDVPYYRMYLEMWFQPRDGSFREPGYGANVSDAVRRYSQEARQSMIILFLTWMLLGFALVGMSKFLFYCGVCN